MDKIAKLNGQKEMAGKQSPLDLSGNQPESFDFLITDECSKSDVFKTNAENNESEVSDANMQQNVLALMIPVTLVSIIASALFCSLAKIPASIFPIIYTGTSVLLILIVCVFLCLSDRIRSK